MTEHVWYGWFVQCTALDVTVKSLLHKPKGSDKKRSRTSKSWHQVNLIYLTFMCLTFSEFIHHTTDSRIIQQLIHENLLSLKCQFSSDKMFCFEFKGIAQHFRKYLLSCRVLDEKTDVLSCVLNMNLKTNSCLALPKGNKIHLPGPLKLTNELVMSRLFNPYKSKV